MLNRIYSLLRYLILFLPVLWLSSCEKFKGEQTVPAYVTIDSIYLTTSISLQGSASAAITDAWVYVDDIQIGTFQLPCRFPVLFTGKHTIKILPGIKVNGIAATRASYPFFAPITKEVELAELDTTALGVLKTTYLETTQFDLIEGFEGVTIAFDTTPSSEVPLLLSEPGSPLTFEGNHSGLVRMNSASQFFECTNDVDITIPFAPVYLEMNFLTNHVFAVGLYLYGISTIQQVPVIYLNPTNGEWKKIYIDLTNSLNAYSGMIQYRIFISAIQQSSSEMAEISIDNVKLVTRKTE